MGGLVSSLSGRLLVSRRSNFFCGQESNSPTFTKHEERRERRERNIEEWHWEIVRNLAFRVKFRSDLLFMLKFNPYKLDNVDRSCIPPQGSWKG